MKVKLAMSIRRCALHWSRAKLQERKSSKARLTFHPTAAGRLLAIEEEEEEQDEEGEEEQDDFRKLNKRNELWNAHLG